MHKIKSDLFAFGTSYLVIRPGHFGVDDAVNQSLRFVSALLLAVVSRIVMKAVDSRIDGWKLKQAEKFNQKNNKK